MTTIPPQAQRGPKLRRHRELILMVGTLLQVLALVGWDWRIGLFYLGTALAAGAIRGLMTKEPQNGPR